MGPYKLTFIGDTGSGKTSLVQTVTQTKLEPKEDCNLVTLNNTTIADISGQARFIPSMLPCYFVNTNAFVIVHDVNKKDEELKVTAWIKIILQYQIKQNQKKPAQKLIPIFLLLNKLDLFKEDISLLQERVNKLERYIKDAYKNFPGFIFFTHCSALNPKAVQGIISTLITRTNYYYEGIAKDNNVEKGNTEKSVALWLAEHQYFTELLPDRKKLFLAAIEDLYKINNVNVIKDIRDLNDLAIVIKDDSKFEFIRWKQKGPLANSLGKTKTYRKILGILKSWAIDLGKTEISRLSNETEFANFKSERLPLYLNILILERGIPSLFGPTSAEDFQSYLVVQKERKLKIR